MLYLKRLHAGLSPPDVAAEACKIYVDKSSMGDIPTFYTNLARFPFEDIFVTPYYIFLKIVFIFLEHIKMFPKLKNVY